MRGLPRAGHVGALRGTGSLEPGEVSVPGRVAATLGSSVMFEGAKETGSRAEEEAGRPSALARPGEGTGGVMEEQG